MKSADGCPKIATANKKGVGGKPPTPWLDRSFFGPLRALAAQERQACQAEAQQQHRSRLRRGNSNVIGNGQCALALHGLDVSCGRSTSNAAHVKRKRENVAWPARGNGNPWSARRAPEIRIARRAAITTVVTLNHGRPATSVGADTRQTHVRGTGELNCEGSQASARGRSRGVHGHRHQKPTRAVRAIGCKG